MTFHCGYNPGQKIRAYDLSPKKDVRESYIEGIVISAQTPESGGFGYGVKCTFDSVAEREGRVIFVPYKLGLFMEWEDRVYSIKESVK